MVNMIKFKNKKFKISSDAVISKIDQNAVLLHLKSGAYFELNEVALYILSHLKEYSTLDFVRTFVMAEFDVKEQQCNDDIKFFLNQLAERDLIEFEV